MNQKEICFRHLRYQWRAGETEKGMGLLGRSGVYGGVFPVATPVEAYPARGGGEQSVIMAPADVRPGVDRCSPLAEDDAPCQNHVPGRGLHPESSAGAVTPVAGTAGGLLVCHLLTDSLSYPDWS